MILAYRSFYPQVQRPVFIAPGSYVIGRVVLEAESSVWFNAVLRADGDAIRVGRATNLQEGVVVHADPGFPVTLGDRVTVGHGAIVHGATVADEVLVGMGAILMNGVRVAAHVLIAAGSLLPEGMEVESGVLVMGRPARVIRRLSEAEIDGIRESAEQYKARWIDEGWAFQ